MRRFAQSVRYAKVVNLKIPWEISLRTRSKPPVARTHHQSTTTDHGPTPGLGGHQGSGMMDPRHSSISAPPLHTAIINWVSLDHRVRILPHNTPAVCPKYFNDLDQDTQATLAFNFMLLFRAPLLVSTRRPSGQSVCPASRKRVMADSPLRTPSVEPEQFLLPRHSASVLG
ncbi:Uncharacterized protein HZ326_0897 [Fusarium oxysporum f. sp. albedinis]|nr:Uncharacterized protein HZ326_0897 [Fusarium oxysporum f. sp. albedinis]